MNVVLKVLCPGPCLQILQLRSIARSCRCSTWLPIVCSDGLFLDHERPIEEIVQSSQGHHQWRLLHKVFRRMNHQIMDSHGESVSPLKLNIKRHLEPTTSGGMLKTSSSEIYTSARRLHDITELQV